MAVQTLVVLCIIGIVFYAFGMNRYNIDLKFKTIHAEMEAMNKLKKSEKTKKVNIVVFRINNAGTKLCMAKPCKNCVCGIKRTLEEKNYKLRGNKCWFTNEDGEFESMKL